MIEIINSIEPITGRNVRWPVGGNAGNDPLMRAAKIGDLKGEKSGVLA